jgi:hypothetical protein
VIVPVERWGRDHFRTLLYVVSCVVGRDGQCESARMRQWSGRPLRGWGDSHAFALAGMKNYPTKLAGGAELHDHDDWDCVEDMVAAGMVLWEGTGMHPILKLTPYGWRVAQTLTELNQAGLVVSKMTHEHLPAQQACDALTGSP